MGFQLNRSIRDIAFQRLAERLQSLKQQNFRRKALMVHSLSLGPKIPPPPHVSDYDGKAFGGFMGMRSDLKVPTQYSAIDSNGLEVSGVAEFNARATNYFWFDGEDNEASWKANEAMRNDFWGIATELGELIKPSIPDIRQSLGIWNMWQEIDHVSAEGTWIDLVFELAWQSIPGVPLSSTKYVYWKGASYEYEHFDELFNRVGSGEQSPPIPRPIPSWYSELDDIVSASQYAIDILNEKFVDSPNGGFSQANRVLMLKRSIGLLDQMLNTLCREFHVDVGMLSSFPSLGSEFSKLQMRLFGDEYT